MARSFPPTCATKRIVIYGGTRLDREKVAPFVSALAYELLRNDSIMLGFHAVRLDRELYVGDVRETVRRLLHECDAIVADVTDRSANVMYEVGLAHACGRDPLLLWRGDAGALEKDLPFYLRPQRIVAQADPRAIAAALRRYLASARGSG